jgi:hypothetical protein
MSDESKGGEMIPQKFSPKLIQHATGDLVNKATAELPDDQRSAIRWLHNHAHERGLTQEKTGALINYSGAAISQLFSGKYQPLGEIVDSIQKYRRLWEARQQGKGVPFIETTLSKKIWDVCHAAREFQRIALIFGESQVGKSSALREYERLNNHGSTVMVEVPTGGSLGQFLASMAKRLRIPTGLNDRDLKRRIIDSFDDRMLLIVDEAHRTVSPSVTRGGLFTIDYIRELFDASKCGVVICSTNVFAKSLEEGGPASAFLKQTELRRFCRLQLPDRPRRRDLEMFAAGFGLTPSTGDARKLEEEVIRTEALGMWLMILRMATKLATARHQTITWDHVLKAHAALRRMEMGHEE